MSYFLWKVKFLFLTTWSLLFENNSDSYVADNKTYLLTFQGNLIPKSKSQVGNFIPFTLLRIQLNKTEIIKSKWQWWKIVKFQYRFKIYNTRLNRRLFSQNYFGLKVQFLYQNLRNIEIFKNLWLRFSKSKFAHHLSS